MIREHEQVFEKIYEKQTWGKNKGSGTGSDPKYCELWLQYLVDNIPIGSRVLDLGCGDHQLYDGFDLTRWIYLGADVSKKALDLARGNSNPAIELKELSATDTEKLISVLNARNIEFLIIKDVLMHWTDEELDTYFKPICEQFKGTIIVANNWRYVRTPDKPLTPRTLDRYSWCPIPLDHPIFVEQGFVCKGYYPKARIKAIMQRDPRP